MQIAGYTIREPLHQGKKCYIYRAMKEGADTAYILKILEKKSVRHFKVIQSLRNEHHFLKQIDSDFVIKTIDWINQKDYTVLVLEDIDGARLSDQLSDEGLPIDAFLDTALKMTRGLAAVHRQNIIHQDVNPNNVIINSKTDRLQLIDFDLATNYNIRISSMGNPENLHGTLAYISPEQTGRLNRRVDQRSDLYSLGVSFFEMLTGHLPFNVSDPMDLVYAHLARTPPPPSVINKQIPGILSEITLMLMAKDPEARYQSAEGLLHDLEAIQKHGNLSPSPLDITLGTKDFSGKLQIPEKLYGREKEVETLLSAYQETSRGEKRMVLVTGYSGTGKTALVNEIYHPITRDRAHFISGKFDQLQRSVPYSAFIKALDRFCQQLLAENMEKLAEWKEKLTCAVGELGKVLTDIIPQLENIIGKQPKVPEVNGEEAEKRFNYVLLRFLRAAAKKEHPLVIFIDDLQWADLAFLNLMKVLMEDNQIQYLMFIGAYRDNEISPTHPLATTLEEIRNECETILAIPVHNLEIEHLQEWLKDTLKTAGQQELLDFSGLLHKKTQGNAFFTIQFLKNLFKEELLWFDFEQSRWIHNLEQIEKQNITDNVVDLLTQTIRTLPPQAQEVLRLAACIGNTFDLYTLSVISEKSQEDHAANLELAQVEQLVFPIENDFYKFAHDRIHQAAYSLIPEEEKKRLHLAIGKLLQETYKMTPGSKLFEGTGLTIFTVANHLNLSNDLLEPGRERLELAWLNLEAGIRARRSGAYKLGADYARNTINLLPPDAWENHYELALAAHDEAIQAAYLCGQFEEMETYVEAVLQHASDIAGKAVAYKYRMLSYNAQNQAHLAEQTLLETLDKLGVSIPKKALKLRSRLVLLKAKARFGRKGEDTLARLPMLSDPSKKLVLKILFDGVAAIMQSSQDLLPYISGKMADLTLTHGLAPETPFVLSLYGIIRNLQGDTPAAYRLGKMCIKSLDKIPGSDAIKPRVIMNAGLYLLGWKEHFKKIAKLLKQNYQYGMNAGDIEWASYSLGNYVSYLTHTDTDLASLQKIIDITEATFIQLKQTISVLALKVENLFVCNLLGQCPNPAVFDTDRDSSLRDLPEGLKLMFTYDIYIKKTFLAYLFDDFSHIPGFITTVETSWKEMTVPVTFFKSDFYFLVPLSCLELYWRSDSPGARKTFLRKAKEGLDVMRKLARFGPVNFLHKYYLLQAEWYRVKGETTLAANFYDKAVETAYENEYVHEAGMANELAAKFYIHQDKQKLASLYLIDARKCYHKWGATAKIKHLEAKYPKYLNMYIADTSSGSGSISSSSFENIGDMLDIRSILKASHTLSGEVQFKGLLEKMMQILIENAGAERGLLIEIKNGRPFIQAEGDIDGIKNIFKEQLVEHSKIVPLSVINYVTHSKHKLVFENVSKHYGYSNDPYILEHQPKSVVCFPVVKKGELTFIIYLENNRVEGAFTPARLEVLNLLSTQMAISVENAALYENLESKVRERTATLREVNRKLEENHQELVESHKKINDSVNYASHIQGAVLPTPEMLDALLPSHFVLYQPCSTVSGDFYWTKSIQDKVIISVVDCTGHGVPGALLSMLGTAFLNEVVPQLAAQDQLTAGNVLDEVRTRVKQAMKQRGKKTGQREGMDMGLCIIEPGGKHMQYAGAHHPLYLIRDNRLIEIKGDKMPIAIHRKEDPFTTHEVSYQPGDMIYLCSDGYADQLSEAKKEKFKKKCFKELLIEVNQKELPEQKDILEQRFNQWKGDFPQVDDVLIFGIRL